MTDLKPVVLTAVKHPDHLKPFFEAVADAGYDVRNFDITEHEALLDEAIRVGEQQNKPVAIVCSQVMSAYNGGCPETYRADRDGTDLAFVIGRNVFAPTLTVIYSAAVADDLEGLENEANHKVINVAKGDITGDWDHKPSALKVIGALDRFFSAHKPA